VYKITCLPTNKAYIGSTTDLRKRWYWHKGDLRKDRHHNRYLQNAWNKYGAECFTFEVLESVMFVEYLHEREQYWLDRYQAYDPKYGFNTGKVARAPWLGRSHSDATRQKLSIGAKLRDTIENARLYAAEWHGSAAGRLWHADHGRQVWDGIRPVQHQCEQCGVVFETKVLRKNLKYCSNNCRSAARRARHADHETRQCVNCGQSFSCNRYLPTRYCSVACVATHRPRDDQGQFV
jgi:group I intron endonuclease